MIDEFEIQYKIYYKFITHFTLNNQSINNLK